MMKRLEAFVRLAASFALVTVCATGCLPCNQSSDCPSPTPVCSLEGFCAADGVVPLDEVEGRFSGVRACDVIPTPPIVNLPDAYTQYTNCTGVAVVATKDVPPAALRVADDTLEFLLLDNEVARRAMIASGDFHILHARDEDIPNLPTNFPGSVADTQWSIAPNGVSTSRGEYMVCNFDEPGFYRSNQFVEVMTRQILIAAYPPDDGGIGSRVDAAYRSATSNGLWANTVAAFNPVDYFGELSTKWLEVGRPAGPADGDGVANDIISREQLVAYDPEGAAIMRELYGTSFAVPGCINRNMVAVGEDTIP